ncbi:MAG: hypothetical protein JNL96_16660 [Planctomycetaceae bacterium]|nr:hypothetical protein [Planctomycetaceae bacterium]
MSHIPDEELISAYFDDELSNEERARAEQLLVERPDLRRFLDELRVLREGLHGLPKYELGDQFGADVLRRAEREMLQSDAAPAGPAVAAAALKSTLPKAVPPPAGSPRVELARFSWERWRRPAAFSLAAVAAAVVLMFVERTQRPNDVALGPAKPQAGDLVDLNGADRKALKRDDAADKLAAPPLRKEDGDFAAGGLGAALPGAPPAAAMPKVVGDPLADRFVHDARGAAQGSAVQAKTGAGTLMLGVNDFALQRQADSGAVASLAEADLRRALVLVDNYRKLQQAAPDGNVAPVQLQTQIAQVDLASQQAAGERRQLPAERDNAAAAAGRQVATPQNGSAATQAKSGGFVAKNPAAEGAAAVSDKPAERNWSLQQAGARRLVIVTCEVTPEALPQLIAPVLAREQIADISGLGDFGRLSQVGGAGGSTAMGNVFRERSDGAQLGETAQAATATAPAASPEPRGAAQSAAGEKRSLNEAEQLASLRSGTSTARGEEFLYMVAPEDKLESTLSFFNGQPQYVLNMHVEPAEEAPAEASRWIEYSRGRGAAPRPAMAAKPAPSAPGAAAQSAQIEPSIAPSTRTTPSQTAAGKAGGESYYAVQNRMAEAQLDSAAAPLSRAQRLTSRQVEEFEQAAANSPAPQRSAGTPLAPFDAVAGAEPPREAKKEAAKHQSIAKGDAPATPSVAVPSPGSAAPKPVAAAATIAKGTTEPMAGEKQVDLQQSQSFIAPQLAFDSGAPALPENYREALFIIRVVDDKASLAEESKPRAGAALPTIESQAPQPATPADLKANGAQETPPAKKGG